VLVFWTHTSPDSLDTLKTLAAGMASLAEMKCDVMPICVAAPSEMDAAVAAAQAIDPRLPIIPATPLLIDTVDILQQDVLGRAEDLILPTAFVVDRLGLLASIFRGPFTTDELARAIVRPAAEARPYAGRMLFPQQRGLSFIAGELRTRGHAAEAARYANMARIRQGGNSR
jgi:hypothetical protein